jgi:hypothetical protein
MSIGMRTIGFGMFLAVVGALLVGWRHRTSGSAALVQTESALEEGI